MIRLLVVLGVTLFWTACTADYRSLSELLNEGNVSSCLWYHGAAGPYLSLTGVTSRGAMTVQECLDARPP